MQICPPFLTCMTRTEVLIRLVYGGHPELFVDRGDT